MQEKYYLLVISKLQLRGRYVPGDPAEIIRTWVLNFLDAIDMS